MLELQVDLAVAGQRALLDAIDRVDDVTGYELVKAAHGGHRLDEAYAAGKALG